MAIIAIYGQPTLTQWDVGRKVIITEKCSSVHYANPSMTEAIVCETTENGSDWIAPIPDELLQVSGKLRVYAFVDGEEGYTREAKDFIVKAKPKPEKYTYTPTKATAWEKLEERIEKLEGSHPDETLSIKGKAADAAAVGTALANKAPAGYGLGETNGKVVTDCNTAVRPGFYALSGDSCINYPEAYPNMRFGAMLVERRYNYVFQTVRFWNILALRESADNGETWNEWEWDNPPMQLGVEYRTTERWQSKAVYTKLLDFGAAANKKQVEFGIGTATVIRQAGKIGGFLTPYANNGDLSNAWSAHFACGSTVATLYCGESLVGEQAYLQIWYTKE